ncbi:MAG: tyrosine-type recombinase/integrase [Atopobiaceae bacterium]|nr:tyrosine-type recombinase/integrase [Atopobiaceae bacterium]
MGVRMEYLMVHPHAFRHLFARRFLAAGGDIALLADLMGHSSVETTRVYLRRTAGEQRDEVNRIVSW